MVWFVNYLTDYVVYGIVNLVDKTLSLFHWKEVVFIESQSSRREYTETNIDEAILNLVPEKLRDGVLDGSLVIQPQDRWYSKDKPLILSDKGRIVAGRYATANDPVATSKLTAYKRTRGYKEMREQLISAEGRTKDTILTLQDLVQNLWEACMGSPQKVKVECPHPESCPEGGGDHVVAYAFKKDAGALFKFYENIVGRAAETAEVTVTNTHLVALLNDKTPMNDLRVIDLTPEDLYSRKQLLEGDSESKESM